MEQIVFTIGLISFTLAILLFKDDKKKLAFPNLMVSIITLTSYAVMSAGLGVKVINGMTTYPTRWLFYAASCSFLMYEVGKILKKDKKTITEMITYNVLVMITGYLASITTAFSQLILLAISTGCFLKNLLIIKDTRRPNKYMKQTIIYVSTYWTLFPITWILSPVLFGWLNTFMTAVIYLVLDLITKILFGYLTVKNT